jgi:hypothetical protein
MGTKHHQVVIDKEGNMKIAQYGQWDGYPSGQGVDILNYLRGANLEKYQENLAKIPEITKKQEAEVYKDKNWPTNYPYLSRNCGAKIHQMIENGGVPFVAYCSKEEANKWCEGFYTIDFQKNTFTADYYDTKKEYSLSKLPTIKKFLKDFTQKEEDDTF